MARKLIGMLVVLASRADGNQTALEELREKLVNMNRRSREIQAAADAEHRALTETETRELDDLAAAFDATRAEIARRERLEAQERELAALTPRQTTPDGAPSAAAPAPAQTAAAAAAADHRRPAREITGGAPNGSTPGSGGFRSYGEFASSVRRAAHKAAPSMDNRLLELHRSYGAPSPMTEGEDGFPVPPDFRTEINQKVFGELSLLARCDRQPSSSNSLTLPKDESTPWGTTGIQAFWEGEADQLAQSKTGIDTMTLRAQKVTALVPVTSELLEDAPALGGYLRRKAPERIDWKVSWAILNGTGAGMPRGIMKSGALVTVAAEGGQVADTVVLANILKMRARMHEAWRRNMIWLYNIDLEPQLQTLKIEGAAGGVYPVWLPPTGIAGSPFSTILGAPAISSELCAKPGDVGDIMAIDFSQYLALIKGGLRQDVSIHLWFDYDVTAFRFILRIGGQPWWDKPIDRADATNTNKLSPYVVLAAR